MTHLPILQRCLEDLRERNKVSAKETTTILITEVSAYLSDAGFLGLEKHLPATDGSGRIVDGNRCGGINYEPTAYEKNPTPKTDSDKNLHDWWNGVVRRTVPNVIPLTTLEKGTLNYTYHLGNWGKSKPDMEACFSMCLHESGGDPILVPDFMRVRKEKKAVNSYSAFTLFMKTVEKSGKTLNEILEICVEMNWKGFRLAWLESHEIKEKSAQKPTSNQPVYKSPKYLP